MGPGTAAAAGIRGAEQRGRHQWRRLCRLAATSARRARLDPALSSSSVRNFSSPAAQSTAPPPRPPRSRLTWVGTETASLWLSILESLPSRCL